jgi:hypothetical protein
MSPKWALAHEADGGVVNVHFDWRPKNNGVGF